MKFGVNRNFNKEPILIVKDIDCLTKKQLIGVISRSSHGFSFPRIMSLNLFILGILILSNCQSEQVQISNRDDLFKNCMETFEDEAKCSSFLKKSEQDLLTEEEIRKEQIAKLTQEELNGLKNRQEMKDSLASRNKQFVLQYLGIPDQKTSTSDREYWIYTRPVSIYAPGYDPDREVTVILRRGHVEKVNVIKPTTTEESGFSLRNLLKAKEERKQKAEDEKGK
jgi:hypothetical protein